MKLDNKGNPMPHDPRFVFNTETIAIMNHTYRGPGYEIVYWNGNIACGRNDKWTRAVIQTSSSHFAEWTCRDEHEVSRMESLLQAAFRAGAEDKLRQIRELIGVK